MGNDESKRKCKCNQACCQKIFPGVCACRRHLFPGPVIFLISVFLQRCHEIGIVSQNSGKFQDLHDLRDFLIGLKIFDHALDINLLAPGNTVVLAIQHPQKAPESAVKQFGAFHNRINAAALRIGFHLLSG